MCPFFFICVPNAQCKFWKQTCQRWRLPPLRLKRLPTEAALLPKPTRRRYTGTDRQAPLQQMKLILIGKITDRWCQSWFSSTFLPRSKLPSPRLATLSLHLYRRILKTLLLQFSVKNSQKTCKNWNSSVVFTRDFPYTLHWNTPASFFSNIPAGSTCRAAKKQQNGNPPVAFCRRNVLYYRSLMMLAG